MKFIKNVATKIIYMNSGEIIETGSVDDIFLNPKSDSLKKFLGLLDL